MDRLTKDKSASRKFLIGFLIIALIGGTIAFFTANGAPRVDKRHGAPLLEVRNYTYYDIRLKGDVMMYYGALSRMYFVVPAGVHKEFMHHEGDVVRIGRKDTSIEIRMSEVADSAHQITFDIEFDGVEGDEVNSGIRIRKLWDHEHWLLIFEEIEEGA